MKDPLRLEPGSRDLLAAAALLHDVGYVVGYRQHHKHSYHLIANAHLDGFTPREREIIALVARYHRRAAPRKKHSEWAKLPREDRKLVRQLSSLLRIADALDRRHSKGIREIHCRVRGDQVRIALETERDVSVELHGAMEKSRLFEEVFGKEIQFQSLPSRKAGRTLASVPASPSPRRKTA
jgi:exopolyphosphatase/guanosine-5'-triphosphate,3'-diphosphate pyrophosphatase